jgi:integrase
VNRTINLELNSMRCMFRYAEELGYAGVNPAKWVKNLRETLTVEHWIPKPEELAHFVAEAERTYSGDVLVAWIWFMAYTGTRPREALFVEWQDIDFEHNRILIRPKPGNPLKNGRSRYVDLHPELRTKMLAWRDSWNTTFERRARRHPDEESPPHQWLFYNPHGQRARAESFLRGFQIARDKAELPQMTPYTLRHFFISYCVMKEIPMLTITRWVGHTSSKMIEQVYGHLSPAFTAQQMRRFNIEPTAPTKSEPST